MVDQSELTAGLEAFQSLSDETRQAILATATDLAWDAAEGPTFAELRRGTGVRDSGRFNYHLDKLKGTFLVAEEGQYHPNGGLLRATMSLAAAANRDRPDVDWRVETDWTCPHCERGLQAEMVAHGLLLVCERHAHVFVQPVPSGPRPDDPEAWIDLAVRLWHDDIAAVHAGRCPTCRGRIIKQPIHGRFVYSPAVDTPEGKTPLWGQHVCEDCGWDVWYRLGNALSTTTDVRRFFHERGVDLRGEPLPQRYVIDRKVTAVVDEEANSVSGTITYECDGDRLTVEVGPALTVEGVEEH